MFINWYFNTNTRSHNWFKNIYFSISECYNIYTRNLVWDLIESLKKKIMSEVRTHEGHSPHVLPHPVSHPHHHRVVRETATCNTTPVCVCTHTYSCIFTWINGSQHIYWPQNVALKWFKLRNSYLTWHIELIKRKFEFWIYFQCVLALK